MKKIINYLRIVLISILCLSMCMLVVACEGGGDPPGTGNGTPPTYKGMTVSSNLSQASLASYANGGPGHGGHHYHGDWWGNHDEVDQTNPFDKQEGEDSIEEEISSTLQVVGGAQDLYYATKNQAIYVTVKLENPDEFEIESFTLNGTKYASYMFEQGSDLENLILKVTVPATASGIINYTLDAIKYIDGTQIKDVTLTGDKTVDVGIYSETQPTATISNQVSGFYDLSFDANVVDSAGVIALVQGSLKAVLYDGEDIIATKDISLGQNSIKFENLAINKVYQYAIVGLYDNFDGDGAKAHVLAKKAVYTKSALSFDDIDVTNNGIAYQLKWDENWAGKTVTSLQLFKGETKVRDLAVDTVSIDDLLSDNQYTVVATYINKGVDEKVSLTFNTLANSVPTVDLSFVSKTQDSITFAVSETDLSNVGQIVAVKALLNGYVENEITDMSQTTITGLLSGKNYVIELTYEYDLNEGNGKQTIKKTFETTTGTYVAPTVTATKGVENKTSLTFEFSEVDTDNVGYIETISLLNAQGNVVKTLEDKSLREFTGLLSNTDYIVKIEYAYDLNEGNGKQYITKTLNYRTVAMQRPTAYVTSSTSQYDKVGFDVGENDPDNVGQVVEINLYKGQTLVDTATDVAQREFEGLLSANTYVVEVVYEYDLNEGAPAVQQKYTHTVSTKAKVQPSIQITSPGERSHAVEFAIAETDVDNVGEIADITLLLNGAEVAKATDLSQRTFEGLAYGTTYTLRVTYLYDLNDGLGQQSIVRTQDIATAPRAQYTVSFNVLGGASIDPITQWEQADVTLPIASKGGHTFIEWKESDESVGDTTYTVTKDVTLTAVYGPYNPAYEYNYYSSKYNVTGKIRLEPITFAIMDKMFDTNGKYLIYIDSEGIGAAKRLQTINDLANEWDVTIHHFNPDLSGGYGADNLNAQDTNILKELTGIAAQSQMVDLQARFTYWFGVHPTQVNDYTLFAIEGKETLYSVSYGGTYSVRQKGTVKASAYYNASNVASVITAIATRKPNASVSSIDKNDYNTGNINTFNTYADARFHIKDHKFNEAKDDVFETVATYAQYSHLLENCKGSFVVLHSGVWDPNSQAIAYLINNIAKDYGIDKIYVFEDRLEGGAKTDSVKIVNGQVVVSKYGAFLSSYLRTRSNDINVNSRYTAENFEELGWFNQNLYYVQKAGLQYNLNTMTGDDIADLAETISLEQREVYRAQYMAYWDVKYSQYNYNYLYGQFVGEYMPNFEMTWGINTEVTVTTNGVTSKYPRITTPTIFVFNSDDKPATIISATTMEYYWANTSVEGDPMQVEATEAIKGVLEKYSYGYYRELQHAPIPEHTYPMTVYYDIPVNSSSSSSTAGGAAGSC